MTVAELIERLQEQPQYLEVVIPSPDAGLERPTHLPVAAAEVRAVRQHGELGGWDLDEVEARTLIWQPGDEPAVVAVLDAD